MFVLAAWSVDSLRKLQIAATVVVLLSVVVLTQGAAAYHFGYNANKFLLAAHAGDEDRSDAGAFDDPEYLASLEQTDGVISDLEVAEEEPGAAANEAAGPLVRRIRGLGL